MKPLPFCLLSLLTLPWAIHAAPSSVMIRLVDPLDEPEFYCIDVPGFRQNVQLKAPLMAHTLKRFGSADEMWAMDTPAKGQIYAPEYELCIEAASAEPGASLLLKKPSDSPLQRFTLTEKGFLVLTEHPELGFAVKPGKGQKAGGPSHLKHGLSLERLAKTDPARAIWKLVKSADTWPD